MMKKVLIIAGAMALSTTMVIGVRAGIKKLSQRKQEVEES